MLCLLAKGSTTPAPTSPPPRARLDLRPLTLPDLSRTTLFFLFLAVLGGMFVLYLFAVLMTTNQVSERKEENRQEKYALFILCTNDDRPFALVLDACPPVQPVLRARRPVPPPPHRGRHPAAGAAGGAGGRDAAGGPAVV